MSLVLSKFSHNSASYCSVLDVDEFYHFNVSIRDSVFTLNTTTEQLLGGGVACIRNASIELLRRFQQDYVPNMEEYFILMRVTFWLMKVNLSITSLPWMEVCLHICSCLLL